MITYPHSCNQQLYTEPKYPKYPINLSTALTISYAVSFLLYDCTYDDKYVVRDHEYKHRDYASESDGRGTHNGPFWTTNS